MNVVDPLRYKQQIETLDDNTSHKKIIHAIPYESNVLDVGCACGDIGNFLNLQKKCRVYGLEYSSESIVVAKATNAYEDIYQVDLNQFDPTDFFEPGQFDRIVFGDVLEHLYDPRNVVSQMIPLLNSSGKMVISLPNISHASIVSQLLQNNFEYMDYGILDATHIRFFTYKSIARLFAELKLAIESADHVICDIDGFHGHLSGAPIPKSVLGAILANDHSLVLQYVFVASPQSKNFDQEQLKQNNQNVLEVLSGKSFCIAGRYRSRIHKSQFVKKNKKNMMQKWKNSINKRLKRLFNKQSAYNSTYVDQILSIPKMPKDLFVDQLQQPLIPSEKAPKAIAFYLPQFHAFPENDLWWGRGFTEWTNVAKAMPRFLNHYQPRLPIDVGYYDLKSPEIMGRQVELAKLYGLSGFCFYYYWFSGKRLMDYPIDKYLADPSLDFPFCFCWANEPWSRRWDGSENDLLINQHLVEGDDQRLIHDLRSFFVDQRYIRIDEKPLLLIYRPNFWSRERVLLLTKNLRETAQNYGFKDLYLLGGITHSFTEDPQSWGFDAGFEFPPHFCQTCPAEEIIIIDENFAGTVYDMPSLVDLKKEQHYSYKVFRTVFPSWDNVARKNEFATIFHNSSPGIYKEWLSSMLSYTYQNNQPAEQIVFINAWNEWAEGAYLEPDRKYGYAYLQATGEALRNFNPAPKERE